MFKIPRIVYELDNDFLLQVVRELQNFHPCARVQEKSKSDFMKILAKLGEKLKIFDSSQEFMEHHATTIGCNVYVNFPLYQKDLDNGVMFRRAATIAHEFIHVIQYKQKGKWFQLFYLLDPGKRAYWEGEAYKANLGLLLWGELYHLQKEVKGKLYNNPEDKYKEVEKRIYETVQWLDSRLQKTYKVTPEISKIGSSIVLSHLLTILEYAKRYKIDSDAVLGLLGPTARVVAEMLLEHVSEANKG